MTHKLQRPPVATHQDRYTLQEYRHRKLQAVHYSFRNIGTALRQAEQIATENNSFVAIYDNVLRTAFATFGKRWSQEQRQ